MNSIDEIFENVIAEEINAQPFDVEEWAANKKAERDQTYNLLSEMAEAVCTSGDKLKDYLDVQSRFNKYSVNNALLIAAQMPEATELADFKAWKDAFVHVNKDAEGVVILAPGKEYTKEDGSIGVSYNVKKVFDISQTDSELNARSEAQPDMKSLLRSLINNAPCKMMVTSPDNVPDGIQAVFIPSERAVFIREDADAGALFEDIAKGLALAHLEKAKVEIPDKEFIAYCASYMLCKRFDLNTERFSFDPLPESFKPAEGKDVKKQLGYMRDITNSILSDMNRGLKKQKEAAKEAR